MSRTVNRAIAAALLGIVALLFVWFTRHVLLIAFGGVLFATFLTRLARYIASITHLPRGLSLALAVTSILALTIAVFYLRGSQIAEQATQLADDLPQAAVSLQQRLSSEPWAQWLMERIPREQLISHASSAWPQITGAVSGFFGGMLSALLVVYFALALAATPYVYRRGLLQLVPPQRRDVAASLLSRLGDTLWWWLIGRLLSMLFVGLATWLGLTLLGIPLAFVLAVLAALLSFVPNIGPVLAAVPAVLLAWMQQPQLALYVIGLYVGVQAIENYVLDPVIDRKTVYLPPALTILGQLVLGVFVGLIGVAFAAPLVAVAMVLVRELYVGEFQGKRAPTPPAPTAELP